MAIAKERIKERVTEVQDEWILRGIQRLLGMSDSNETDFIATYQASLRPMTATELQQRAYRSEQDIADGKVSDF